MALSLKVSSSLEQLAAHLADNIKTSGKNFFDPHYIVTQTEGMNNWLKLQLAERLGIFANCRFLKPNDLIHQVYYLLNGRVGEMLSANNLSWLLYRILGEKEFTDRFPSVADYYQNSGPEQDTKRMGLAEKMADLFDQYQIYRPDMMREWNSIVPAAADKSQWQQYLWVKAKEASSNMLRDKTLIGDYILYALKKPANKAILKARMPEVHLFGISIITEYHVHLLHALSSVIDVHFHLLNPAPMVFWLDDKSEKQLAIWRKKGHAEANDHIAGNTLLTGWGRVIQDTFGILFQYDAFLNAYEVVDEDELATDTLLQKIQHDIFYAATSDNRNELTIEDVNDGSITINACYTIAREVEVLYNYLVHLIDKGEALSARDIVVMVSDIDAYAPYIKAVFSNAPYSFRYTIADESYASGDSLFEALTAVLAMTEDSFKAESVLQLLDLSYIRKRFALTDVAMLRQLVRAANIHFGIEGSKEDDTRLVSWKYGLKRIMYGLCMSGGELYGPEDDGFYPLDILEGSSTQEAIRFCHFVEVLISSIEERKRSRSIADWVIYIEQLFHDLIFEPNDEADEEYTALMEQLADYNVVNELMNEQVSFEVFLRNFQQTLHGYTRTSLYANGGITFCSLIPMRSIPFKVVAMLGLNYDKFPRRDTATSFNLMKQKPKRGDRSMKENDKHLFLETVLSAKQYLYISYIGRNAKDNTVRPPSSLVDELLDYIESGVQDEVDVRKQMIMLHPLQGFSSKYNAGDERLYSYLNNSSGKHIRIIDAGKNVEPLRFEEISLDDLVRFFRNPFKAYYNKVLGIYYTEEEVLLSDTELFSLDNLQQWSFKNQLLAHDVEAIEELKAYEVKTGGLPLSNMAGVAMRQVAEVVNPVRELYNDCTAERAGENIHFTLELGGVLLKGAIDNVFDRQAIFVCWSKGEMKYLIDSYIRYLVGVAAGILDGYCFLSANNESIYEAVPLSKEQANERLVKLISIYKEGHKKIAPFCAELAWKLDDSKLEEMDEELFRKEVTKSLDGFGNTCTDKYIMHEYKNGFFSAEGLFESYKSIYRTIVSPLAEIFPSYFE